MAYLRQEDKDRSRELWAEAFPEDTGGISGILLSGKNQG